MGISYFEIFYKVKDGLQRTAYVVTSDYQQYKAGTKTAFEAFGDYLDSETIKNIEKIEKQEL